MNTRALCLLLALAATSTAQEPPADVVDVRVPIERALAEPAWGGPPEASPMRRALQPVVNAFAPEVELRVAGPVLVVVGPRAVAAGLAALAQALDAPVSERPARRAEPPLPLWEGLLAFSPSRWDDLLTPGRPPPQDDLLDPLVGREELVLEHLRPSVVVELLGRQLVVVPPEHFSGVPRLRLVQAGRDLQRLRLAFRPRRLDPAGARQLAADFAAHERREVTARVAEGEVLLDGPPAALAEVVRLLRAADDPSPPAASRALLLDGGRVAVVLERAPAGRLAFRAGRRAVAVVDDAGVAAVTSRLDIFVPLDPARPWRDDALQALQALLEGGPAGASVRARRWLSRPAASLRVTGEPALAIARALDAIARAPGTPALLERHVVEVGGRRAFVLLEPTLVALDEAEARAMDRALADMAERLERAEDGLRERLIIDWSRASARSRSGLPPSPPCAGRLLIIGPVRVMDELGLVADAARVTVVSDDLEGRVVRFVPSGPAEAAVLGPPLARAVGDLVTVGLDGPGLTLSGSSSHVGQAVRLAQHLDDPPPRARSPGPARVALGTDHHALVWTALDAAPRAALVADLAFRLSRARAGPLRLVDASQLGRVLLLGAPAHLDALGLR